MSKKNKTILLVSPYGFNDRMANYVEFITARLLAKNNWQVFCITRCENKGKKIDSIYGVNIYRYQNLIQGIRFLLKILIINRPSIIHIYQQRNNRLGILAAMLSKLSFKPLLFTEYGLLHDHYLVDDRDDPLGKPLKPNGLVSNLKQIIKYSFIDKTANLTENAKNYFFHWALTHADKIIFVSKHNLPLSKTLGLKNYSYLPYIQDDARWSSKVIIKTSTEDNPEIIKKIKILESSPFCLFIGQLKLRKGWDIYLEAISLLDKSIKLKFALLTSSAKELPKHISDKIEKLGIKKRVIFLGKISDESFKKIYDLSSIIIVPSRYEGFGLIAIEAFELKKPLIASAVPALTENVIDGFNSLTVPPKNPKKLAQAIEKLNLDKELRKKLVTGGQKTLAKLKSNEFKNQWLNFYNNLIF